MPRPTRPSIVAIVASLTGAGGRGVMLHSTMMPAAAPSVDAETLLDGGLFVQYPRVIDRAVLDQQDFNDEPLPPKAPLLQIVSID